MAQTNILLEAGTNELEVVEFYLDEAVPEQTADAAPEAAAGAPPRADRYRGYYGVNVAKVLEIIRMPKVTELPEVQHPSVRGAFNLRSRIIPLVDLAMWLGKTHPASEEQPKTIVTEFNNVTTAFMVSGVNRIHRISWERVEPPNKYVAAVSNNTVIGVVKLEDRIVFLLDLEKVVADLNPRLGLRLDDLGADWTNTGYKALVADDSALVREMLRDLLEKAGFAVEVVSNGRVGTAGGIQAPDGRNGPRPHRICACGGLRHRNAGHGRAQPYPPHQDRPGAAKAARGAVLFAYYG